MKNIEIDDELYLHIVANTQSIGENASSILRRLLKLDGLTSPVNLIGEKIENELLSYAPLQQCEKIDDAVSNLVQSDLLQHESQVQEKIDDNADNVFHFINKEELAMQRGAVGRFLLILAALYRAHPQRFNVVTQISGRDRLYFALSEAELSASGSSTKPKQIPESPYWVLTNSNTTRKKMMLTKAASSLGYNNYDVEKIRELL